MMLHQRLFDALERAVKIAGRAVLLEQDSPAFAASLQPDLRLQQEEAGPLGVGRGSRAVLYAPINEISGLLQAGSRILWNNTVYQVLQREDFDFQGRPLYLWAALAKEGVWEGV